MKLDAETLLLKTYRGYLIYSYVLRQYSEVELLKYFGQKSPPLKNPFLKGRKSLIIELKDGMACHYDLEYKDFRGDAFDFANWHFRCKFREDLYRKINEELQLGLGTNSKSGAEAGDTEAPSPLVSFFSPPIRNIHPSKALSLLEVRDLIAGPEYQEITEELRRLEDPKARREFKASRFPYVTFSGTFSKRQEKSLLQHSGLLAIDLDDLQYPEETRQLLLEDADYETEMLFVTPSGKGLKWILKFDPDLRAQKDFFLETAQHLSKRYRLKADPAAKDIPRASFIPHDPEVYIKGG